MVTKRNSINHEFIGNIQFDYSDAIFNPKTDSKATADLLRMRESYYEEGGVTALTSGVYDGLHPNHWAYLLHVKALGAADYYQKRESGDWRDLPKRQQEEYIRHALSKTAALHLILSVDGDKSVAIRKNGKGGSKHPIYGWNTRALMAAQLTYRSPEDKNVRLPVVDAVTIHGRDDFPADSPYHSIEQLAMNVQPDIWGVYDESTDILDARESDARLAEIPVDVIASSIPYWWDDILGSISTTTVVERIIGDKRIIGDN